MTFCNFSAGHFICSQSWYAQNLSKIEMMDISYRNGLWCHWWTLLKRPLYLDDVALIVRSSLLVVDVGTIFVWIKSEGESWGNFHIVLNMRPIFDGRREKIFQLRCCQTPDPDLNQCILMRANQCSWGESGYNDNLYPTKDSPAGHLRTKVSSKNKILWYSSHISHPHRQHLQFFC